MEQPEVTWNILEVWDIPWISNHAWTDQEEQAHLPGQAPAEDSARASQDQHGCGR